MKLNFDDMNPKQSEPPPEDGAPATPGAGTGSIGMPPNTLPIEGAQAPEPGEEGKPGKRPVRYPALRQRMTEVQFTRMVQYACERLASTATEMREWRHEIERSLKESANDFSDRVQAREAQIFIKCNESANIIQSAAEFVKARICDDVFGTEPWFMVVPERTQAPAGQESNDTVLATELDEHARWKLRGIGWKGAGRDSIASAVDLGTGMLKTTWKRRVDASYRYANVLVHAANPSEAVTTGAGEYIFEDDATIDQVGKAGEGGIHWAEAGEGNEADPTDPMQPRRTVVRKDVNTVVDLDKTHRYEKYLVEEKTVKYDDPCTELVDLRNIVAPLNCSKIEELPFIAHVYDRQLSDLRKMLPPDDPKSAAILAHCRSEDTRRKEPARAGESHAAGDEDNPWVKVGECYFDYDPLGDGNTCRVYLVVLPDALIGIDMGCDYLANVVPRAEYPFDAVAINKKKNSWVGTGFYEAYRKTANLVDRIYCSILHRNDFHSNPIVGIRPNAFLEEPERFDIKPGQVWRLKNEYDLKNAFQVAELPDLDNRSMDMVEFAINLFQARTGVTSAAQGSTTDLPQINTATGTNAVLASGNTLSTELVEQIRGEVGVGGLINHLDKTIRLIYTRLKREETFQYGEGQFQKIGSITPQQVADLTLHVHLLLTRFRQKQDVDRSRAAIDAIAGAGVGYLQIAENEKEAVRPLFVQLLKGHGYDNADSIVRKPLPPPPMPGAVDPATGQPVPQLMPGQAMPPGQVMAAPAPQGVGA